MNRILCARYLSPMEKIILVLIVVICSPGFTKAKRERDSEPGKALSDWLITFDKGNSLKARWRRAFTDQDDSHLSRSRYRRGLGSQFSSYPSSSGTLSDGHWPSSLWGSSHFSWGSSSSYWSGGDHPWGSWSFGSWSFGSWSSSSWSIGPDSLPDSQWLEELMISSDAAIGGFMYLLTLCLVAMLATRSS